MDPLWPQFFENMLEDIRRDETDLFTRCPYTPGEIQSELSCSLAGTAILLLRQIVIEAQRAKPGFALRWVGDAEPTGMLILDQIGKAFEELQTDIAAARHALTAFLAEEPTPCSSRVLQLVGTLITILTAIKGL